MWTAASCSLLTFRPVEYWLVSRAAVILRPVLVVVFPIKLTMTERLSRGLPRQLLVIWQNIRCSILFHLLVPGGKWQTEIRRGRLSARPRSPPFPNTAQRVLLPPG